MDSKLLGTPAEIPFFVRAKAAGSYLPTTYCAPDECMVPDSELRHAGWPESGRSELYILSGRQPEVTDQPAAILASKLDGTGFSPDRSNT